MMFSQDKIYLAALLLAVIPGSVCIAEEPVCSIKVSGIVNGISGINPNTLIINECDISEKSERCIAELDSTGRFAVKLPFYYGHTFTINYGRGLFINAYAEPGDSLFVSIDATKSPVEFHLKGDRAKLNEEYSHAFCDLSPIYYDVALPPDTAPLSVYMPKFKNEVERTRKKVETYIKEKSLMPQTAELLLLDNIFNPANQAITFMGKGIDEQMAFFTDPLFDISNERNLKVMIFPYHLSALLIRNKDIVNKTPKSGIRDVMFAILGDKVSPDRNDFANPAYYDRLYSDNKSQIDFSNLKPGNIMVFEDGKSYNIENVNPIEWLRKRFEKRPVYLDLSATWCGPCRAGIAAGESVRQHFKDSDVVFAILWLKSDLESLKAIVPKIGNAVNIFVPNEDMSNRIMSILNIDGFPSYYFMSRDGVISTDGVPHFNNPQLVEFLRSKQ